ncbi:MAG: hypothetical protein Q7J82_09625 [Coriobacteriia bacterium]|nr:hypothetical protein [Coriobacteriia bacterium]
MIISEEQVRRAVEYLHTQTAHSAAVAIRTPDEATIEIIRRVIDLLRCTPDVRVDRVAEARVLLAGSMPSTEVVAGKLIGRVISDSIR